MLDWGGGELLGLGVGVGLGLGEGLGLGPIGKAPVSYM